MNCSKKIVFTVWSLVVICLLYVYPLEASQAYQLTFTSRYIWRGFDLNPPNKPALQPSITFNFGNSGLSLNLWGSFSFEDKHVNETDATLAYTFKTPEKYVLSVGFIHYGWYFAKPFKFKTNTTQEVYVAGGLPKAFLAPTLTVYYDFNNGDGTYMTLGLAHSLKLSENVGVDLTSCLGYTGKQWVDKSGFSNLSLNANIPIKFSKVTLTPFANVVFILMDEVNPGVNNELAFGASLSF